jgi:hypothetical protein
MKASVREDVSPHVPAGLFPEAPVGRVALRVGRAEDLALRERSGAIRFGTLLHHDRGAIVFHAYVEPEIVRVAGHRVERLDRINYIEILPKKRRPSSRRRASG